MANISVLTLRVTLLIREISCFFLKNLHIIIPFRLYCLNYVQFLGKKNSDHMLCYQKIWKLKHSRIFSTNCEFYFQISILSSVHAHMISGSELPGNIRSFFLNYKRSSESWIRSLGFYLTSSSYWQLCLNFHYWHWW